ncbi:MAG TPA: hypothetical protein VFP36_06670 [Usitatibacter sp.]|nr:hypothetical protein [Usitatibacter sp.]
MSAIPVLTREQRRRILLQECLALQDAEERRGAMPAAATVVTRLDWLFEALAAIALGLACGAFAVLGVFLLTRVIFHIDLTRYFFFLT